MSRYQRPRISPPPPPNDFSEYDQPRKRDEYFDEPDEKRGFFGVPPLALAIICLNYAIWVCGFVSLFIGRTNLLDVIGGASFMVLGLLLLLCVYFLVWKMYWWFLALSTCLTTIGLVWLYFAAMAGKIALQGIVFMP